MQHGHVAAELLDEVDVVVDHQHRMGAEESTRTAQIVRSLIGQHTVLVIDHDIDFVEQLGGHVAVLHQGHLFKEGTLAEVRNDPDVASIYLGRPKT